MAYGSTYYCDPAAGGANDGSSWNDAWTSFQSALDTVTAGDVCYCRGTQTLAAVLDVDTNSGSTAGGYCKFIGCAADGSVDGTRFVIDANSAAANCLLGAGQTHQWFENIEFKNATGDGVNMTSSDVTWVFVNCISHNNGANGFDGQSASYWHLFVKCQAYSNTDSGWANYSTGCEFFFCVTYDNGDDGFGGIGQYSNLIGCIAHDNGSDTGDYGFQTSNNGTYFNCVADGEVVGIYCLVDHQIIIASRITNNTTGIDFSSERAICGWNLFHNNTNDLANPAAWAEEGVYAGYIHDESETNTNLADQDADDGYENRANDDFNIKTSRTYNGDGTDTAGLNIGS